MSKQSKKQKKSPKDFEKILKEISKEEILSCKLKCKMDLNENIKVLAIRKSNEMEWYVFNDEDQNIDDHKEFSKKVQRRFSSKNVKNSSEIDVFLDEKSKKIYLKNGEFIFNGRYLSKLNDVNYELFDPALQDPQIFIDNFCKEFKASSSDSDLFNKLESTVSPSVRTFIIQQKLKACTFDDFKVQFIKKYKSIHFDIVSEIIYSKFDNTKNNLESFIKKKVNLLDRLLMNCTNEELLVKLVICSFPPEERSLLFTNLDYNKECLIKRSKDLIAIKNLDTDQERTYHLLSSESSEESDKDNKDDKNVKDGKNGKDHKDDDDKDDKREDDKRKDDNKEPPKKRGRPSNEELKKREEEKSKREAEKKSKDDGKTGDGNESKSEDDGTDNDEFFDDSVIEEAKESSNYDVSNGKISMRSLSVFDSNNNIVKQSPFKNNTLSNSFSATIQKFNPFS